MTALRALPNLGVLASVVMDQHTHGVRTLGMDTGEGLRDLERALAYGDAIPPGALVDEINVVSIYSFHVALYALQQGTPEACQRALELIGVSGDVEEHCDFDSLLPLPVPEPRDWKRR
jgi:hypothetical protein